MKFHKLFIFMMILSFAVIANSSLKAQDDDDDMTVEEEEMDEEEWQRQMDECNARRNDLISQLSSLNTEVDGLLSTLGNKDVDVQRAEDDLYAAVGTTRSGVADFRSNFEATERRINNCKGPDDAADIEATMFAQIAASKIRCLPEFWDRFQAMQQKLNACKSVAVATGNYTVVKGDCLWKIAGMPQHYGNPRLWPAIWEANRDGVVDAPARTPKTIPNPNLIYPGQVLRVPTLTDAQKESTLKMNWRTMMRNNNSNNTNNQ